MRARGYCGLVPQLILLVILTSPCCTTDLDQLLSATHPLEQGPAPNPTGSSCDSDGNITIASNDGFQSLGFPGMGTPVNPYLIEGLLNSSLYILNTTARFVVSNCSFAYVSFSNTTYGVVTDCSFNGLMEMVNCRGCSLTSDRFSNTPSVFMQAPVILLDNCSSCCVRDCQIQNCTDGILVMSSDRITVRNNSVSQRAVYGVWRTMYGVFLAYSEYCLATNNSVTHCYPGMDLYYSHNCTVIYNTLIYNEIGLVLYGDSSGCSIVYNTLIYNGIGLELESSTKDNRVYGNKIGWNEYGNAQDSGWNNEWDDGVGQGNAWSDYSGLGVYEIHSGGVDHYPSVLRSPTDYALGAFLLLAIAVLTGFLLLALFHMKEKPV